MAHETWRLIKNKADYEKAMERLLLLANNELVEGSDELDEFELLSLIIEHYEQQNFAMDKPDPIEAIKFRMDQQGLTQADMREYIGSASKVSEVLNYKRPLSLSMIKRIHVGLGIPAEILIQDAQNLEWSPVAYGAENFAIAFGETCKKIKTVTSELVQIGGYEEIASSSTTLEFKAPEPQKEPKFKTIVNVEEKIISSANPLATQYYELA